MQRCRYQQNITDFFNLGKVLGKGQFGTTRLAVQKDTGEKFACKSITKRKLVKQQVRTCLEERRTGRVAQSNMSIVTDVRAGS